MARALTWQSGELGSSPGAAAPAADDVPSDLGQVPTPL